MDTVLEALKSVFDEFDEVNFGEAMKLGDIPGWDSMNSVNLQIELEEMFDVDLSDTVLEGSHSISDVIGILRKKGCRI